MGKVKTVKIDAKGDVVEVYSKPEVILFDIETGTIKKQPKKGPSKGRQAGRALKKGGKV